ncbi:hypothetical protein SAMN05192553_104111 [Cyclobacterium xiamenense]|uniref:Uncharacterized protein n=1 Tax=Cyclobacterium xiamenense TaxID=1297121 RepID=A0A1H6YZQ8_9BACT|nr:hypothetical protein [Cyclobacterium xiamenense]SEJ46713.1 hypothetical protein SAMN05192553_104111 [Cyclobacterium xiamenense]
MNKLSENWISEGWIDFEYKKYLLLAYLKEVNEKFQAVKLYPSLGELIAHHQKLSLLDQNRSQLKLALPKEMEGIDLEKMKITYKHKIQEDDVMKELGEIIAFSLPKIKQHIEEGKSIYDFIESHLEIEPVGLTPIYQREGYALLSYQNSRDVFIYRYQINLFQNSVDRFRGIALRFVAAVKRSLTLTYERIKMDLVKKFTDLPNPSTWRIQSAQRVPLEESLLPVSKRLLLKYVTP